MKKWDYIFLSVPSEPVNNWITIQTQCKLLGDTGWELVTVTEDANPNLKSLKVKLWVFKKPLEDK